MMKPYPHSRATRRTIRARAVPVLGLLVAAAIAGCGGDDGDDDAEAASADDDSAASDDSNLAFYQCLRDNGLDVEDPEQPGAIVMGDIDTSDPAVEECASEHLGTGDDGAVVGQQGDADPEAMIEFAECMRENGVEDFPDPTPEGGLNMTAVDSDAPEFQTAMEECGELLGGSGPVVQGG